jgi:DNA-binding PadR family transcriptional regulator
MPRLEANTHPELYAAPPPFATCAQPSVAHLCRMGCPIDDDNGDIVPANFYIGEFEQLVMLAMLQLGSGCNALSLRELLSDVAGRRVSRGALYRTLDRLDGKGFIAWLLERGTPERGGHPRRLFRVTARGVAALRASRHALLTLWTGLESVLD